MESGIEAAEESSPEAAEGHLLHACMKDGTTTESLTGEQQRTLETARELRAEAMVHVFGNNAAKPYLEQTLGTP